MISEDACFIQVMNGGKPRSLPVIRHSPKLSQKRRKDSRTFCQKFYFISCLCNMGTNCRNRHTSLYPYWKDSRTFCQKFYFISCLCNMGTNWCACFDCELSYCLI